MNAPNDCPAVPLKVNSIVPSGNPAPPKFLVMRLPSMVPTVRLTFLMAICALTSSLFSSAGLQISINSLSKALAKP